MFKHPLAIAGGLIALYLVVRNYTGASSVISAGAKGGTSIVDAFQGR